MEGEGQDMPGPPAFHSSPLVPLHLPHLIYQQTEVHGRKLATTTSELSSSNSSEPPRLLQPNQHLMILQAADKCRKSTKSPEPSPNPLHFIF